MGTKKERRRRKQRKKRSKKLRNINKESNVNNGIAFNKLQKEKNKKIKLIKNK